jgi:DNA polymerase-4
MQQISIDEAFLDVSDDPRPGKVVAARLQTEIRDRFQLPTSWGVASNKLVAKIATEVGKPNGLIVVPPGSERDFLAPLPVEMLWGVGPKTRERLAPQGIYRIGDLAALPDTQLRQILGDHGPVLAARARGQDDRPVVEEREPRSMSAERTFAQDISDRTELSRTLMRLSERVGYRLRKSDLMGKTVRLKLRWPDFRTLTRQKRLKQPTDQDREIFQTALELFERVWREKRPVRLLGVGVSELGPPVRQLSLWDSSWDQDERLLKALDDIRNRYGTGAVKKAGYMRSQTANGEQNGEDPSEDQLVD